MPATIDMILEITGRSQVYFVCFSQGCTASLVMGALRPDYNKKIRLAAKMGPVAYLGNMKGLGGRFLPIVTKLLSVSRKLCSHIKFKKYFFFQNRSLHFLIFHLMIYY